jgi:hypothetical protein
MFTENEYQKYRLCGKALAGHGQIVQCHACKQRTTPSLRREQTSRSHNSTQAVDHETNLALQAEQTTTPVPALLVESEGKMIDGVFDGKRETKNTSRESWS